jgi:hypothetical protein
MIQFVLGWIYLLCLLIQNGHYRLNPKTIMLVLAEQANYQPQ